MEAMKNAILRRPEVEARTGLSRSTIYARMNDGSFPQAVRLGPKSVGWREHDIESWISGLESRA